MSILNELRNRLRALFTRAREDRELDEELAFHLEMAIEENVRRGMTPEEARRQARLRLGGPTQVREAVRDARGVRWLDDLAADLRYALRTFGRSPGFVAAAVLTLGLGIGANSALFGLLNSLTHRMPPGVPASERLVRILGANAFGGVSYADFLELKEQGAPRLEVAASFDGHVALGSGGEPVQAPAQLVTGEYFDVLGVRPVLGRGFVAEEASAPGGAPVAVIGHELWRGRFGGDPAVVGRTIVVNGHPFTVVGVAPPGFVGLRIDHPAALWVPITMASVAGPLEHDLLGSSRGLLNVVGRTGPGVSVEQAGAAVAVIAERLGASSPERGTAFRLDVEPLQGWLRPAQARNMGALVTFAWALTGLVLLIACANVANLLLARAVARRHELGVRLALGAGRGRVVRQLLAESLLLALAAGAAGTLLAFGAAHAFQATFRGPLAPLAVSPDARTLGFTLALTLATGLVFGLVPAWRASRPDVRPLLASGETGGLRAGRVQGTLVVTQIALSVVLLFAAGVLVRRAQDASRIDVGYDTAPVVVLSFDLFTQRYDAAARAAFLDELRSRLERLPGVEAAAVPAYVPFAGAAALFEIHPEEDAGAESDGTRLIAGITVGVGPDYFRTLGIPITRGRPLEARDAEGDVTGVVVSESLARRVWPDREPLGRRFRVGSGEGARVYQVVGIARDVVSSSIVATDGALVYPPHGRAPFALSANSVAVRAMGDAGAATRVIREEIRRMDDALPVFDVRTLAEVVDDELGYQRRMTAVVAGLGALALALATIGLYGVIAYNVAGRTREVGVRIALGAPARSVSGLFVWHALRLSAVGLSIGAGLSIPLGRLIGGVVHGARPLDPLSALGVVATLGAAVVLASYLPARRAARVEPMVALRE